MNKKIIIALVIAFVLGGIVYLLLNYYGSSFFSSGFVKEENVAKVSGGGASAPLVAPTSLSATAISAKEIRLNWQDTNTNETGYDIERSIINSSGVKETSPVISVGKNIVYYLDAGLSPLTTYYYQVRARGSKGKSSPYSTAASATTEVACANSSYPLLPRNLWTWQSAVATDTTARANFFTFADAHAVRTIYLESQGLIANNQASLDSFIKEAKNQHCMDVELLFGNANWTLTQNHATAVDLAQKSVQFFAGATGAKPIGVHFDVEPYALAEWSTDQNGVANQYLDLLEKISAVTTGTGLKFTVDMPFWFDGRTVVRADVSRVLSEAIIDRTDGVVIMDYRDTGNSIISLGETEIIYAQSVGKELTIGVETRCSTSEPEYISFCEEGANYMEIELMTAWNYFKNYSKFKGFAVHDYKHYGLLNQ